MSALLCDTCQERWPVSKDFATCPACLVDTELQEGMEGMTKDQAESAVKHIKFERWYAKWEDKREKRGDPSPETVGALEAKEILQLEKGLLDA